VSDTPPDDSARYLNNETGLTYRLGFDLTASLRAYTFIECQLCGARSFHPSDIAHRYCGRCHLFHDSVMLARIDLAAIGPVTANNHHECEEWKTPRGVCALCGTPIPPRPDADR